MAITGFRAWWSDGGLSWTAAQPLPDADASPVAVLPGPDGGILAWGYSCGICPAVTHWWTSRDGDRWTAHEVAPGLEGVAVTAVTATEAGYLAEGVGGVPDEVVPGEWLRPWSEDAWRGGRPPVLPDGARVRRLLSVGHGTLAAAEGTVGSEPVTYVLGRGPGDDGWRALAELRDLALIDVIQHPVDLARVMVVGHRGDSGTVVAWIGGVDWAP
jgi:hypothetical protein